MDLLDKLKKALAKADDIHATASGIIDGCEKALEREKTDPNINPNEMFNRLWNDIVGAVDKAHEGRETVVEDDD